MGSAIQEMRAKIAEAGALMLARNLTDLGGGNISVRVDGVVCITPRYAGSRYQWRLRPEQVIVCDLEGNQLEGEGEISREAKVHFKLLNEFTDGKAVIHAHPRNVLVFCAARRSIPPVLEYTVKFGEVKVISYAPGHSTQLAEKVAEALRGQEERVRKQAAAVIAPWHGLFVLGKDLEAAVDAVERIEVNARCILLGRILAAGGLDDEPAALAAAVAASK